MARRYAVGDRVIVTRKKSVSHFRIANVTIKGTIAEIHPDHYPAICGFGPLRPFLIRFDDGRESWWAAWEFVRIKER